MTAGIALGELCADCTRLVRRQAARVARWVALGTTLALGVYLALTLRAVATEWRQAARTVAIVSVAAWYFLTYRITTRVALEWLRHRTSGRPSSPSS